MLRFLLIPFLLALCVSGTRAEAQSSDPYYEIETLNAGLPAPPEALDRSTPRATIEALLRAEDLGDWETAAHLLDLSALAEDAQATEGPKLARQLATVISRKIVIDWAEVIDRPDALDTNETSNAATAGQPRRSILLWELSPDRIPISIRLNRQKPDGGEPVWVIAPQTVPNIPTLYAAYGPSRFETRIPSALRQDAFWGLMWWELIGLPILVAAALFAGFLVSRAIRIVERWLDHRIFAAAIRASRTPAVIAAITTVMWIGTATIFVFSGRLDVLIQPLVAIGFVTSLLMLIVNTIEAILDGIMGFEDLDLTTRQRAEQREMATKIAALRRGLVLVVFLFGAGIVLASADVFQSYGFSLLASAGALTLVLGFAARKVLGNIMASMQIALNQSARIGDRVLYKDHLCHVERINFTYVQLRDWVGTRLVVPVEEFANETFENWTLTEPAMLRILKFKMHPKADIDALRDAFAEVIKSLDPKEVDDPENASVKVTGQDVFGIDVWFAVPCADPSTSWDLACEAREMVVLKAREIEERTGQPIFPDTTAIREEAAV